MYRRENVCRQRDISNLKRIYEIDAPRFYAERTWTWLAVYTNKFSPTMNITAATTRKIIGDLSNHIFINGGAGRKSYLPSRVSFDTTMKDTNSH